MRKIPACFSTSTISAGIRRDVSISNARAVMVGRNSCIALRKDSAASDEGDTLEEVCLVLGETKRLLMIVPCSLRIVVDLSTKRHPRKIHGVATGFRPRLSVTQRSQPKGTSETRRHKADEKVLPLASPRSAGRSRAHD